MKKTSNGMERKTVAQPKPVKGSEPGPYGSKAQPPPSRKHGSWWTAKDFKAALADREKDSWGPMGSIHISSLTTGDNERRPSVAKMPNFAPRPRSAYESES